MHDYETARRRQWLGISNDLDAKRAAAIAYLGTRWLLHPVNAPKKGRHYYGQLRREVAR